MMRRLLECPIPNKHVMKGFNLQQDLVLVMRKCLYQLLKELGMTNFLIAQTHLGTAINKFLECSMLISTNQMFLRYHIESMAMYSDTLVLRVKTMRRNFY